MAVTPTVLAVRCPRCGGEFCGVEQDVVFWCDACRIPFEVANGQFRERHGALAQADISSAAPMLSLPVWAFRVRFATAWPDPDRERRALRIPPADWVYVTGFTVHNAFYFGDPGQLLTEQRATLRAGGTGTLLGCSRGLEDAKRYVEPHLLSVIGRRVDVTGMELSVAISEVLLWGVPYFDEGTHVRDGILGRTLPAAAVDALSAIRQARKT